MINKIRIVNNINIIKNVLKVFKIAIAIIKHRNEGTWNLVRIYHPEKCSNWVHLEGLIGDQSNPSFFRIKV